MRHTRTLQNIEQDTVRVRNAIVWAELFHKPGEVIGALWVQYANLLNETEEV